MYIAILSEQSDSHSESPGPYVIHDRRHQQPQNVVTSDI